MTKRRWCSFKDILDDHKGVGPGFHILRLSLALAVFLFHARFLINSGSDGGVDGALMRLGHVFLPNSRWFNRKHPFDLAVISMYFALSGFLVMGSAERVRSTSTFLAFRVLRIIPALTTEVVLSAVVLGGVFTSLPLMRYYGSPGFVRYFGNIVGWVVFDLPGVFYRNPSGQLVNLSLWTLPPELECYTITAVLMLTGLLFQRRLLAAALLIATIVFAGLNMVANVGVASTVFPAPTVAYYFFVGLVGFQWRAHIPHNWLLFCVSAVLGYLCLCVDHAVYIAPVFVTYCTVFIGLLKVPQLKLLGGDYSYGIYLYHFPITQAVIATFPDLRSHWATASLTALVVTIVFAVFSWHIIEKPCLMLKSSLPDRLFPIARKALLHLREE